MTFPRIPGDSVCDAFRAAAETNGLTHVEVGAALATLIAGWLSSLSPSTFATDEQVDSVIDMLTDTVKVSLEEHRKMVEAMQKPEPKRVSPFHEG
jgi:hypothetical protein